MKKQHLVNVKTQDEKIALQIHQTPPCASKRHALCYYFRFDLCNLIAALCLNFGISKGYKKKLSEAGEDFTQATSPS